MSWPTIIIFSIILHEWNTLGNTQSKLNHQKQYKFKKQILLGSHFENWFPNSSISRKRGERGGVGIKSNCGSAEGKERTSVFYMKRKIKWCTLGGLLQSASKWSFHQSTTRKPFALAGEWWVNRLISDKAAKNAYCWNIYKVNREQLLKWERCVYYLRRCKDVHFIQQKKYPSCSQSYILNRAHTQ